MTLRGVWRTRLWLGPALQIPVHPRRKIDGLFTGLWSTLLSGPRSRLNVGRTLPRGVSAASSGARRVRYSRIPLVISERAPSLDAKYGSDMKLARQPDEP